MRRNSSGDENSSKKVVGSVGGLTPSDLAKNASLRTLKNKRNHDRHPNVLTDWKEAFAVFSVNLYSI